MKHEDENDRDDRDPDNQGLGFRIVLRCQFLDDVIHGSDYTASSFLLSIVVHPSMV